MSFVFAAMPWHDGEKKMHKLMASPRDLDNPTSPFLSPGTAAAVERWPLLAVGALDADGRPWTAIWGGNPGFAREVQGSHIAMRVEVDSSYDPVVEALMGEDKSPGMRVEGLQGKMVGGLTIDLETRRRVKLYGKAVAGALVPSNDGQPAKVELITKIEQSLPNCPKYLNQKHIFPYLSSKPQLVSSDARMPPEGLALLSKSDLFFLSSSHNMEDMDTNHRGGPPGFVRAISNTQLVWPEYSGNRLYQTLGNLQATPLAGLVFPDFDTGDVLYISGRTEVLVGKDAADVLPRSNLAVLLIVEKARFFKQGLFFRGREGERSPYNPTIRRLATEQKTGLDAEGESKRLRVLSQTSITPTISRFQFQLVDPKPTGEALHKPGQWVALDFSKDLDMGYSHMRDTDPRSLNDDFIRTFTVSSNPREEKEGLFEVTMRKVGRATNFLFSSVPRKSHFLEIGVRGFGGEFIVRSHPSEKIGYIAGGVGITPLLAAVPSLDLSRFYLVWSIQSVDVALVLDTFSTYPCLASITTVFVTGSDKLSSSTAEEGISNMEAASASVFRRRLQRDDFSGFDDIKKWFTCTSPALRKSLLEWLAVKEVLYEDFNY